MRSAVLRCGGVKFGCVERTRRVAREFRDGEGATLSTTSISVPSCVQWRSFLKHDSPATVADAEESFTVTSRDWWPLEDERTAFMSKSLW